MTNSKKTSPPKPKILAKKISFWTLYKKFKFEVIRHYLITTVWTFLLTFVLATISNITEKKLTDNNFSPLLPEKLQKFFPNLTLKQFAVWGLVVVCLYALVFYFSSLWEEKLRIKGGNYAKNLLLDKFRQLPLEEKQARQKEISTLVELDAREFGRNWEHLPNHVYHSTLTIILLLWIRWDAFSQMGVKEITFSFGWLLLINIISYFFTKLVLRNDKRYKQELTKEWAAREKETSQALLIDSMGLTSQYRAEQRKISKKNEKLLFSFSSTKSLNKTIPYHWLAELFPFFLIFISSSFELTQKNLLGMWFIFENFGEIFHCFWDYADYSSSKERINNFLLLPEKNDNLTQIKLPTKIPLVAIRLENISFRYQGQKEWVLKNYTRTFTPAKINRLIGKNGTGKSTILYLVLGLLTPHQGQVIIEDEKGNVYNLHKDINLQNWRENNVAYCAHDTLLEEGSTGQKQLTNINKILNDKKTAQIFLFDEADNALDQDNQEKFHERIKELVKKKIVIYIKH